MTDEGQSSRACSLCANQQLNHRLRAREMMYGTGESFEYLHCAACGVLQLMDVPADMGRFYPSSSYYSVHTTRHAVREVLKGWRDRLQEGTSPAARLIRRYAPNIALAAMTSTAPNRGARVLDVGCGDGALLRSMGRLGYRDLTGVDPLLAHPTSTAGGMRLFRGGVDAVDGPFDLISFHHSLEHISDQVGVLRLAAERLAPGGVVLVRIPTCESAAFTAYGPQWVQLDAPRHLFLHSHRSIALVASRAGLAVQELRCDSQPMQFWASDMYVADVPLMSGAARRFKRMHRRLYRDMARWANSRLIGDQIVVKLRRA